MCEENMTREDKLNELSNTIINIFAAQNLTSQECVKVLNECFSLLFSRGRLKKIEGDWRL